MNAFNITDNIKRVYRFIPIKFNKNDTIYQGLDSNSGNSFITPLVKVEKFQGYSNAYNLGLYFRIKDQSSWSKSKQITGMWKTNRKETFYGDIKDNERKTLLIFKICPDSQVLTIYEYLTGYYPNRSVIDSIVSQI
jgi:hypothetical protein